MEQDEGAAFQLLDEPEPRAGTRPTGLRWELVSGLLLLLVVAGWGGWDWWQQQTALSNYRAGDRYATARAWDAARAAFLAAGDFGQARARAADAAQKIRDRDATYTVADAERAAGQWAAALRDFRQVQEIEPGFRDSAPRTQQAEQQVYRLALSGTVALRITGPRTANPTGLYLYLANGWNYLPGSDAASQVHSRSSAPCLVYDTPAGAGPGAAPPRSLPAPARIASDDRGSRLRGRSLMVAQYGSGQVTAQPLAFDSTAFAGFACDGTGVLGRDYAANGNVTMDLRLVLVHRTQVYTPTYQPYNSAVLTRRPLPGAAWTILTADTRTRLVIGDYTDILGYDQKTTLYMSAPNGSLVRVAERPAIVQAAWLSPDGHYLLTDELVPPGTGREEHRLVLLSTDQRHAPAVLMTAKTGAALVLAGVWYDAAFIETGVYAGKLLIERKTYPHGELRLIDPADPPRTLWSSDQINYVDPLQVLSLNSGLLLPASSIDADTLTALYVDATGQTTRLALPAPGGDSLSAAMESGGRLVYVYRRPSNSGASPPSTIRSIPWPATATVDTTNTPLFSAGSPLDDVGPDTGLYDTAGRPWSLGSGLLAYVQDGQLAAKTYDGTITVPLEGSVARLYQLRP